MQLRLVVQLELVALHCAAHLDDQRELLRRLRFVLLVVERVTDVRFLCRVHCGVGALKQHARVCAVRRIHRDSDAGAHLEQMAVDREWLLQRVEQPVGDGCNVAGIGCTCQEHSELVVA